MPRVLHDGGAAVGLEEEVFQTGAKLVHRAHLLWRRRLKVRRGRDAGLGAKEIFRVTHLPLAVRLVRRVHAQRAHLVAASGLQPQHVQLPGRHDAVCATAQPQFTLLGRVLWPEFARQARRGGFEQSHTVLVVDCALQRHWRRHIAVT